MKIFHADHGVTDAHWAFITPNLPSEDGFFIKVVELSSALGDISCGLYGPSEGDKPVPESEVHYACRNGRSCASRLTDKPVRPARWVVVIGIRDAGELTIFTAYGSRKGCVAEQEPGDTSLPSWDEVQAAREFWKTHALSA